MPVILMLAPVPAPVKAWRVRVPRVAALVLPSRFRMAPPERLSAPVLDRLVPLSVRVPALALMTPVLPLLQVETGARLIAPAIRLRVPLLVKVSVAMVVVWPAVLETMVPLLTRLPVELLLKLV